MAKSNQTDYRRIQDTDGSSLAINGAGSIFADTGRHNKTAKDGEFYYSHEFTSVGAGSTVTVAIVTNGKYPHGEFVVNSDNAWRSTFELSTVTDVTGGTEDYQFNLNRGRNNNNSVASFYFGNVEAGKVVNLYKTLSVTRAAEGKFTPSISGKHTDWLLDTERAYIIHVTNNGGDAAWINVKYVYHEHQPTCETMTDVGEGEDETEYDSGGHT